MLGHSLLCKQLIPPTLCRAAHYRHPRQCADLVKALKDNGMLLQGTFIITLVALLQPPHRSHGSAILQNSPLLFRLSQIKIVSCYLYSHKEIFSAVSVRHIWTLMHPCSLLPAENIPPNTDPHHSRFLSAGRRAKFAPPKKNKLTKNKTKQQKTPTPPQQNQCWGYLTFQNPEIFPLLSPLTVFQDNQIPFAGLQWVYSPVSNSVTEFAKVIHMETFLNTYSSPKAF